MEIKNIFSKLSSQKEEEKELFLALEISLEIVKGALWTIKNNKTTVVKVGAVEEWEEEKENSLINAVDSVVSSLYDVVDTEPKKVILGLPENWVKGSQINEERKKVLGKLCQKLELQPVGFVVTIEALAAYLKNREGTPINAIFIQLLESQIIVTIARLGKILGSQNVSKSEDLAADVREGLARFDKLEDLPSRMILFNGAADFEEAKQQLISYDWQKELPFLHFPKVENLDVSTPIEAVALSGGAEAAKSLGFDVADEEFKKETDIDDEDKKQKAEDKSLKEEISKDKDKEEDDFVDDKQKSKVKKLKVEDKSFELDGSAADLGFIQNKDIKDFKSDKKKLETEEKLEETKKIKTEDVKSTKDYKFKKEVLTKSFKEDDDKSSQPTAKRKLDFKKFIKLFSKINIIDWFKSILAFFKIFRKKSALLIVLAIIFLLTASIGGFAFYWYIPKANITIYLEPKLLEDQFQLTVDPNESGLDKENSIIPGDFKEISVKGEKTEDATGEKLVGEKAEGKILIYNKTDLEKDFAAGAVLIGPDKLKFILEEDVKIASKSSEKTEEGEQVTYGKANAQIKAASIGAEYNLSSYAQFSFNDYPSSLYSAKADGDITGGSSRQVKAVSEEDLNKLDEGLTKELMQQAQDKYNNQKSSEEEILSLDQETALEIIDKEYSHEEGEEAERVSLKIEAKYTFLVFNKNSLSQLALSRIEGNVPDDYIFEDDSLEIKTEKVTIKDDQAKLDIIIKASLVPELDLGKIKEDLKGRYPEVVQDYLKRLPNFSKADIEISPKLPAKLNTLPKLQNNISIEIKISDY